MSQQRISIENYLYKTDTSIRRTLLLVPKGVHLKRFYCIYQDPRENDQEFLYKYLCKSRVRFNHLISLVLVMITEKDTQMHEAVTPEEHLDCESLAFWPWHWTDITAYCLFGCGPEQI